MERRPVTPIYIRHPESLRMLRNQVLIKLERNPFELSTTFYGIEAQVFTESRLAHHLCTRGAVIKSPVHVGWSEEECFSGSGYDWCPSKNEIVDGDTVYLNYMAVMDAYNLAFTSGEHKIFDLEGVGICIAIHYAQIILIKRADEIIPLNNWVIMEMLKEKPKTNLVLPDNYDPSSRRIMRVVHKNDTLIEYFDKDNYFDSDEIPLEVGDICITASNTDIPLEGELDAELGEKFMVQRTNILSKINRFAENEIIVKVKKR